MKIKYQMIKDNPYQECLSINLDNAYNVKKIKNIGPINIYDNRIIIRIIKKKFDQHFKEILKLMIEVEESDEDPSSAYLLILDEADKFKKELVNKYNRYLKKEHMELLKKKIEFIEKEVKSQLIAVEMLNKFSFYQQQNVDENEEEEEKETRRHR